MYVLFTPNEVRSISSFLSVQLRLDCRRVQIRYMFYHQISSFSFKSLEDFGSVIKEYGLVLLDKQKNRVQEVF